MWRKCHKFNKRAPNFLAIFQWLRGPPQPVTCGGQTYVVVGGVGAAAQVVAGTATLIPAAFVQVSSWTDPATGQTVTQTDAFSIGTGRRTGQQGDRVDCAYTADFVDPAVGTVRVTGTVTGFFTPRS